MTNLETLSVPSLLSVHGTASSCVPYYMVDSRSTLSTLDIGFEASLVRSYVAGGIYDDSDSDNQLTKRLRSAIDNTFLMKARIAEEDEGSPSNYLPNIDRLMLRGLDIGRIVDFEGRKLLDINSLTHLTLESCCDLSTALPKLANFELPRLLALQIRHETMNTGVRDWLEIFLCSLPPLRSLFLLLEGKFRRIDLNHVLQLHGEALNSLIVDIRGRSRVSVRISHTLWKTHYLKPIVLHCPHLTELGLPFRWELASPGSIERLRVWHNQSPVRRHL